MLVQINKPNQYFMWKRFQFTHLICLAFNKHMHARERKQVLPSVATVCRLRLQILCRFCSMDRKKQEMKDSNKERPSNIYESTHSSPRQESERVRGAVKVFDRCNGVRLRSSGCVDDSLEQSESEFDMIMHLVPVLCAICPSFHWGDQCRWSDSLLIRGIKQDGERGEGIPGATLMTSPMTTPSV